MRSIGCMYLVCTARARARAHCILCRRVVLLCVPRTAWLLLWLLQLWIRVERRYCWLQPNRCLPIHLNLLLFPFLCAILHLHHHRQHNKRECYLSLLCVSAAYFALIFSFHFSPHVRTTTQRCCARATTTVDAVSGTTGLC